MASDDCTRRAMSGPRLAPHLALSKHRAVALDDAHRRFADPKRRKIVPSDPGIWEISDEIPAQPAARRGGSLAGVVCQPGLHVGALVRLERWAVARCDGACNAGARRAGLDPAAARERRIGFR